MPLTDGKRVAAKLREAGCENNHKPPKILLIGGNTTNSEISECLDPVKNIRANYFIKKPIYYSDFEKIVNEIKSNIVEEVSLTDFKPTKVLIVDDDTFNLTLLGQFIARQSIEFVEAKNGKEAVSQYEKHWREIGLVFMDSEMPELNGDEATRKIREFQNKFGIPKISIIGLSGNTGIEFENKCKAAGMNSMLSKPIDFNRFTKILQEMRGATTR